MIIFVEHNYECPYCHANTVEKPDDICSECVEEIKAKDAYAFWEQEQIDIWIEKLDKNQVQRKFGKLIIGKTTGYAARWLYRLLMRNCLNDQQ